MHFNTVFHDYTEMSVTWLIQQFGLPKTVIEIGVFEGHTTFNMTGFLAQQLPDYKHYAIDPHGESDDIEEDVVVKAGEQFKQNLAEFQYKDNIEFLNTTSWEGLMELYNRGVEADLIFVDGDHRAATVMEDMVLGFRLLKKGGVMLLDDCISWYNEKLQNTPKLAVDSFTHAYWDKIDILRLPHGCQIAFVKK